MKSSTDIEFESIVIPPSPPVAHLYNQAMPQPWISKCGWETATKKDLGRSVQTKCPICLELQGA